MILCCGHVFSCKTQISLKRFELSFFKLQYKLLPQGLETGNTPINLSENVCILKMAHDSLKLANISLGKCPKVNMIIARIFEQP